MPDDRVSIELRNKQTVLLLYRHFELPYGQPVSLALIWSLDNTQMHWPLGSDDDVYAPAHYRHCFPVKLGLGGCSFQFGRTSMCRPRAPHLAHTTLFPTHDTACVPKIIGGREVFLRAHTLRHFK